MDLRKQRVEQTAVLPDGRTVLVTVGVPDDSYISKREMSTVDVELYEGDEPLAAVETALDVDQTDEAREIAAAIARALEAGEIEPSAGAIEPIALGSAE